MARLVPFCKLANPAQYVACPWDLTADLGGRRYWVDLFKRQLSIALDLGIAAASDAAAARARAADCQVEFFSTFDAFAAKPATYGRVDILILDRWRDSILRRHGFVDPYWNLKQRENTKALPLLPAVCRELDELPEREQPQAVISGVLAGNIFDMGAESVARDFLAAGRDFHHTRQSLSPRPWQIDDLDRFADRIAAGPTHRKAVFFVDNAGSDFLLGAVPMIRWLARRGTQVVLAANTGPTLNDMTIDEVNAWWPRIVAAEASFAGLPIQRVATGTCEPLIDLSHISPELNAAAADADLVILEGMGRGVESNLEAAFSCDALNVAMIKDQAVAARHGAKVLDCVCQFVPAARP
jgi:damage-control phosphatase, subfamily II, stand-alone protein